MLGWECCLSANLPRSIETPLPSTVAQPGSSIIHPHVRASHTPLRSHLCIAGLAWLPPAPGLAPTQVGGLGPHDAWCGAGNAAGQGETETFCGAETTWLRCSGVGSRVREGVPAYPSPHVLCPQRVSLAPQIGPVVVAKRHRSSVALHNAVSRDPSAPWVGMGCVGCPVPDGNAATFSPAGLWVLWGLGAQLSSLCACALQPAFPRHQRGLC